MSAREEMAQNIGLMMDGKIQDEGAARILARIEETGATPEQIAGAVDAVMARAVPFPEYPDAVDCCGTGGDYQHGYNISTTVAFVVAACGLKVAKHGNRAITSQSGSADVLQALGVVTSMTADNTAKVMDSVGMCFLFAPSFHPGFAQVSALRKAVGHRTIFNLLGPLCNPAKVQQQLIGVYEKKLCEPVAKAAQLLGRKRVMVVHGEEGCDELSVVGATQVSELRDGAISNTVLLPKQAGIGLHKAEQLKGGNAKENAAALRAVLEGEDSAYADAVVLNAAAVLYMAGKAGGLRGGATMAHDAITKGDAKAKLEHLILATQTVQ